ncbi:hypothetical protein WMF18_25465 [Sorangium sp. So ce315]|uniref:hypothetical protein n=1 Tax=Sorangium sp. So ce315 TaxID=3133299 RepID=UPI003F60CF5C
MRDQVRELRAPYVLGRLALIHPPQDAVILGPSIPNVTASIEPPDPGIAWIIDPPHPGIAWILGPPNPNVTVSPIPPRPGVEMTVLDPCPAVASIEPPDPHALGLELALAFAVVALRR